PGGAGGRARSFRAAGGQREVAGRRRVLPPAIGPARGEEGEARIPPADRGRMGVRLPGRGVLDGGVLLRFQAADRARQLRPPPAPVGASPPNALGFSDRQGNLWEWCNDWLADDYYAQSPRQAPTGPADGALRVLRGGSWFYIASSCRSAIRFGRAPEDTNDLI